MTNKFFQILGKDRVGELKVRSIISVPQGTPLNKVIALMKSQRRGSTLITSKGRYVGIFTERDLINRVIGPGIPLTTPVEKVMTQNPVILDEKASISEAIQLMSFGKVRHLPLTQKKKIVGMISVRDILDYFSDHFPYEVYNLPPDVHQVNSEPEGA